MSDQNLICQVMDKKKKTPPFHKVSKVSCASEVGSMWKGCLRHLRRTSKYACLARKFWHGGRRARYLPTPVDSGARWAKRKTRKEELCTAPAPKKGAVKVSGNETVLQQSFVLSTSLYLTLSLGRPPSWWYRVVLLEISLSYSQVNWSVRSME